MIYLFVFNYFCFRVHYLLTSALRDMNIAPTIGGGYVHGAAGGIRTHGTVAGTPDFEFYGLMAV